MHQPINIGVIGAGMWGKQHIATFQKEERACVRWACDTDPQALETARSRFGVQNLTDDYRVVLDDPQVDAVIVVAPPYTHVPIALEAMQAGKHMVVEKPSAVSPEEVDRLVGAAASHPELVILEGSARHARLNPKFTFVRDLIRSGALGEVYHIDHMHLIQTTFVEYNPNGKWSMNKKLAGGGPFLDWGVYDLSFHLGVLDDRPQLRSLRAFHAGGLRDLSAMAPVVDIEMHGAALMEFDGGLTYFYERGGGVHGKSKNETRIFGTKGGLHLFYPTWETARIELFTGDSAPRRKVLEVDMSAHPEHDHVAFVRHFLDCLEGRAEPLMPVALAGKHLKILFQILA